MAQACSCLPADGPEDQAEQILGYSDAAFIGKLVKVKVLGDEGGPGVPITQNAIFKYRVRTAFGAKLGRFVRVRSNTQSASCGLGQQKGRKIALGLSGRPGKWTSGLCSYMDPKALKEAAPSQLAGRWKPGCG